MKRIRNSLSLFLLLAVLLLFAFFLPDLVGTVPGMIGGGIIIVVAWLVYLSWSQDPPPASSSSSHSSDSPEHRER